MEFNQLGRSMVEMLGVLAIIGVLSVGAISGYSKAMMKYKLNKQNEQITTLINGTIIIFNSQKFDQLQSPYSTTLFNILKQMNSIPLEMIQDDSAILYDSLHNRVMLDFEKSYSGLPIDIQNNGGFFKLNIGLYEDKLSQDSCINVLDIGKNISSILWQINLVTSSSDETSYDTRLFGNNYCYNGNTCLKNLTIKQMQQTCASCEKMSGCRIRIMW